MVFFVAAGESCAGHALAQASFFEKIAFEASELLVEQVVCDLDEADDDVGTDGRVGMLNAFSERLVVCA